MPAEMPFDDAPEGKMGLLAGERAGDNAGALSVSEISNLLKRHVEQGFSHVRIRGEISGFKRAASGHLYLALKDENARLDAVMWRGTVQRLNFQPEDGLEHLDSPMPDVPAPGDLRPDMEQRREIAAAWGDRLSDQQRRMMLRPRPIEMRTVDKLHWMNADPKPPRAHSWFRTVAPLPDDAALHRAVIAYASDYTLLGTSALPHGLSWMRNELVGASLDHAIWFHRDARADEWLLYTCDSPWSGGSRGFNRGQIFQDGRLVASVAQEGMIRRTEPRAR